jgi:hypothetical protein
LISGGNVSHFHQRALRPGQFHGYGPHSAADCTQTTPEALVWIQDGLEALVRARFHHFDGTEEAALDAVLTPCADALIYFGTKAALFHNSIESSIIDTAVE